MEQTKQKLKSRKKVIIYAFLLSAILLCIMVAVKLLPYTSLGADATNLAIEAELEKYINYSLSNKNYDNERYENEDIEEREEQDRGTLLQCKVTTRIEDGDRAFPVQENQLMVNLGQIEGQYPYEAKTITGEETQYDATTGTLSIYAKNQREATYIIVAYYDTYTENQEEREIGIKVQAQAILANEEHHQIGSEEDYHTVVTENIGELTSIHCETQDIYNGYLKSNKINGTSYTTPYEQIEQIVVSKKEAQSTLETLEQNTLIQQDIDLGNHGHLVYQRTQILKSDKDRILGEEGTIEFLDGDGNIIATIDANTPFDESGIFTISYENEEEAIGIRTSPIIQEGILQIKHTKAIKETMTDVKDAKIKTTIYRKDAQPYEMVHEIKDTQTKVEVDISHTNWSNRQQNELTFDVYLDASTVQNNMFKNPSVQIELPSQVEKVVLDSSSIMYGNELELQEPYVTTNEAGKLVMVANLVGTQTQYDENTLGLRTNIKIEATVILKKEMQSTQETVKVGYSNQYTLDDSVEIGNQDIPVQLESYQEEKVEEAIPGETSQENIQEEQDVQEIQEEEESLISSSYEYEIEPLAENNSNLQLEVVPTKGNHSSLGEGGVVYEGEYIKYNIKVTNTSEEDMENVKVVTSIPEGVTYGELETQLYQFRGKYSYNFKEELRQRTIDIGKVEAGKTVTTFYEVKVDDLSEGETQKQIFTTIQSYVGEQFAQSYEMSNQVQPSEVQLFMSTLIDYGGWTYGVNLESETQEEVEVKIHLPQAYQLEQIVYIPQNIKDPSDYQPNGEEDNSYEEIVYTDYSYEEGNSGEQIRTLKIEIDDNNVITTKLKTNCFYEFTGKINTVDIEKPSELTTKVELTSYVEAIINGNSYCSNENRIEVACPNVKVSMTSENEGEKVKYEDEINYEITIENIGSLNVSEEELDESVIINVLDFLPEGVDPQTVTYDTWEIAYKDAQSNEDQSESDENEKVEQIIDRLEKKNITEDISGEIIDEDNNKLPNVDLNIIIPKGEIATIKIKTTAGFVYRETVVENSAMVSGDKINTKTTNTIKHTILPYNYEEPENPNNPEEPDDPTNPSNPGNSDENNSNQNQDFNHPGNNNQGGDSQFSYTISGTAWIDENEDGKRSSEESALVGVTVMLVNMEDTNTVKSTVKTNSNGNYQFSNLPRGNYLVIFKYDTNQYTLTEYQKSGVDSSINSDASSKTITLYGEQIEVGITDTIQLNTSVSNIDIGLIEKKACDFKIDKYINKVTVQTKSGSKQYNYDNAKLAKTEMKAKEIEGATIVVEYKIVLTNEGEIAGTVNKIVDYLPDGFSFSSNLNKAWVKGTNNQLISTSLANRKIAVGESVDLTLIATKRMTANATGTFTNQVVIENATSIASIVDKNTGNNTSSADVILSVSTGAVVYIMLVICILIVLSLLGICLYRRGKIKIIRISKKAFLVLFSAIMILSVSSDVFGINYLHDQSFDRYAPHKFHGGPTGEGVCMDHSLEAFSTNGRPEYKFSFQYIDDETTDKKESTTGDFTLKKKNSNGDVKVKESGNNYIYGPFKYNCTKNATYSVSVYDNRGSSVKGGAVCKSDGTGQTLSGNGNTTFYVKIPKSNCGNGISKIELKAKATITTTTTTTYLGKPVYKSKKVKESQRVRTDLRIKIKTKTQTSNKSKTKKIEWTVPGSIPTPTPPTGNLEIIKQDADTGARMSGVGVRITCSSPSYDQTFITDTEGRIFISNLQLGTYQVQEVSNPYYGYTIMVSGSAGVTAGATVTITLNNQKQTGNLKISKVDLNSGAKLAGVSFKIKASNGEYIKPNGEAKVVGKMLVNSLSYTTDENDATEFVTDSEGVIELHNLLAGDYQVIETSVGENIDYDLDDNYISWSSNKGNGNGRVAEVTVNRQLSNNTNDTINDNVDLLVVKNRRKYIDLAGYVWLDMAEVGKDAKDTNGLYQDNEYDVNDRLLQGITVQLKDIDDGSVVQLTDTDGQTYYAQVETNGQGIYQFKRVEIDELENYYIEFTYNGMSYQSVKPHLSKNNGSQVAEGSNRTEFNQNYETITSGQSNKYDLTYETDAKQHTSKLLYREDGNKDQYNYGYYEEGESDKDREERGPVSGVDEQYKIQANTLNTYGGGLDHIVSSDTIRDEGVTEISNINLGIEKREKPDLNVEKNLHKVQVNINGQTHAYNYDDRYKGPSNDKHSVDPQVKFKDKYGSFSRPLYASDVYYQGDKALQVKVTYKIEIGVPNSASLTSIVNELDDYYADNYENDQRKVAVGRKINPYGDIIEDNLDFDIVEDNVPEGYHKIKIKGPIEINGQNNEKQAVIYVQLEVRQNKIVELLGQEDTLFNITEITSYSTKQNNETYAAIDKDSQPGNLKVEDTDTFEGDTSKAPGLTLVLQDERMTSGTVFMDDVKTPQNFELNSINTGQVREGNGAYETDHEQGIQGVTVELVKADPDTGELKKNERGENDIATIYQQGTKQWIEARTVTDVNGEFMITGFIPDYYKIVYTWGGQTYIKDGTVQTIRVQEYKGTIYQNKDRQTNLEWYKERTPRYSDAMDNYNTRTAIDEQSKMLTNHNDDIIDQYQGKMHLENGSSESIKTTIDSLTPVFRVNIEYSTEVKNDKDEYALNPDGSLMMNGMYVQKKEEFKNYLQNVDFGIVERAKQALKLDNEVARVKITLANGNVLMDAKIGVNGKLENDVKDTVYLPKSPQANGQIKFELDNEIIQSAQLEVEYRLRTTNISEVDYKNENYYWYGTTGTGQIERDMVNLNARDIVNYIDNNISIEEEKNSNQNTVLQAQEQKDNLIEQGLLENTEEAKKLLKDTERVYQINEFKSNITPKKTQFTNTYEEHTFLVNKLLSNMAIDDEMTFNNNSEIIKTMKSWGAPLTTIPGNCVQNLASSLVANQNSEEDDDEAETIIIIPPTGLKTNNIAYTMIAITSLGVLITGIILIKKFVLK